ncbi:MAG TPA: DsbA family oxidoreductase [Frankiaceae bacterium]|nr:DsbA family oxidoreductase [Frankiaceae bacterium]
MRIDIWSDVVCPWCYIGKRRFERALADFPHAAEVDVIWHSFELDPQAPRATDSPPAERLAAKYGLTVEQAQQANERLTSTAADEGLEFHLDEARSGNSFDAHRLIHLAADLGPAGAGLQGHLKERLLRAYFTERIAIGEPTELHRLAVEVGLDADAVQRVLDGDEYGEDVRADEAEAHSYGISGVPFFVVDDKYGISGAQPTELFTQALNQAWSESHSALQTLSATSGSGPGCDGDACDV